ncbi:Family 2 glycosyl transferase [Candidatus Jidaibacter acanthamoeba]|uniref:Family 2 glycosyl transferase n=1 Tax=Candidatus Jidaibacter acanthamoebae TaxID=86105 RepID=A0A0C1QPH8_9RICK|nr:glycosyltransferase family 2 protein [Candidatus Jidaibacter acanthamoeba]KIE05913.1 Family 2 glycosyl transferase [Candidatus Jidaibacter acanthamoeba]
MQNTSHDYQYDNIDSDQPMLKDAAIAVFDYNFVGGNILEELINKEESAEIFLSLKQKIFFSVTLATLIVFCIFNLSMVTYYFLLAINLLYFLILILRVYIILIGKKNIPISLNTLNLNEQELPRYTILVPLFKESEVISQLVHNLENLDYPKDKLQILLILEETDIQTQTALKQIKLKNYFTPLIVPYSYPQTKPKACNYALKHITGEYLVIFDAEDKPETLQLKKAVANFKNNSSNLVCCQGVLSYYNLKENWLTQMFSLEYAILFQRILPAFDHLNLPIPLGGTSNHFKTNNLRQLGGWDSYNVTEDADLGIKCARAGFKVKMIPTLTEEEATITLKAWLKQRSRWIKGFIQTYFVHMRNPSQLFRTLGLKGFITFNLMFGVCNFLYILVPLAFIVMYLVSLNIIPLNSSEIIFLKYLNIISLITGILSIMWSAFEIKQSNAQFKVISCWWSYPLYILLLPIASLLAVYQIFTKLHFWEKTKHGVTIIKNQELNF